MTSTALHWSAADLKAHEEMEETPMQSSQTTTVSGGMLWAGRIAGALAVLFLLFDGVVKLLMLPLAVEATAQLGYPAGSVLAIGLIELVCLVLYVIPRTSILGAILLTGYLGGAVATHVRIGSPLLTHVLFPVYVALLVWGALFLHDGRVRALIPLRAQRPRS